jgi:DNA-binding MarR family transcriptional regulator
MKNQDYGINTVRKGIVDLQFGRIMVFADMIDRYLHVRLRSDSTWLRLQAAILIVNRGGKMTPTELAILLLRSRNSITRLVAGLEKDGYVKRAHSKLDRRVVTVEITQSGLNFTQSQINKLSKLEREIHLCLEPEELKMFIELSRKLRLSLIEKLTGYRYQVRPPKI